MGGLPSGGRAGHAAHFPRAGGQFGGVRAEPAVHHSDHAGRRQDAGQRDGRDGVRDARLQALEQPGRHRRHQFHPHGMDEPGAADRRQRCRAYPRFPGQQEAQHRRRRQA
ncbi:hypothetical protein G6F24_018500 [Rhizopus arrhizus]|nr:hypothetical protein G6F24_018500 [Rhizopus arrhizus]